MKDQNRICIVLLFSIIWICKPSDIARKNLVGQEILILRAGGQGQDSRDSGSGFISIGRKVLLEKFFPDWPERVAYQKDQEKFYKSGRTKLQEASKIGRSYKSAVKVLTAQEKDALDYFNGTGFYEKYQNPKTLPNIFDTRQSFLLKMEFPEVQKNFLNSYNNRVNKNN